MAPQKVDFSFLTQPAHRVAPQLLGCILERKIHGKIVRAHIVETEAYGQTDAASHSYNGRTPRAEVMFGPAGYLYVYFTYGMHYCCNIVTGREGEGAAVLIRAVQPIIGEDLLMQNRAGKTVVELTNGPAKTCQALGIDRSFNGHDLRSKPLQLIPQTPLSSSEITATTRIGIKKALDKPRRFYITHNPYVSQS